MVMRDSDTILFKKGKKIFKQGEHQNFGYIIVNGSVDIVIKTDEGEKTIATIGAGNLLGEMALFDGEPRSATAIAKEEVVCYKINQHHISRLYGDKQSITRKLLKIQAQRIRNLNDQFRDHSSVH